MHEKLLFPLFLTILSTGLSTEARELRGDGSLNGPGTVEYIVERAGAPKEDLRVQALIVGHRKNGNIEELLASESLEVIPSGPSRTELQVSEDNYRNWSYQYVKITAALKVLPRPDSKVNWQYKNLLDPSKADAGNGRFRVHGRWVAP